MGRSSKRPIALCAIVAASLCSGVWAGNPSDEEQYLLELLNRMRMRPAWELGIMTNIDDGDVPEWMEPWSDHAGIDAALRYFVVDAPLLQSQWSTLSPAPPLAWNSSLHDAAAGHNGWMIQKQLQCHQVPGEPDLVQRVVGAGYVDWNGLAENIYCYAEDVDYAHAGFAIDWGSQPGGIQDPPGHRENIMAADLREVGIAIAREDDPQTQFGPLVITQDFGRRSGDASVTGVIFDDQVKRDYFYTPGEGVGDVKVEVMKVGSSKVIATALTTASGGYAIELVPGAYTVRFSGGVVGYATRTVTIADSNVKLDNVAIWRGAGADGGWSTAANWFNGVPMTAAYFGHTAGGRTVVLSDSVIGAICLDSDESYDLAGGLRLEERNCASRIDAWRGSHSIQGHLTIRGLRIDITAGAALTLSGTLDAPGETVRRSGGGVLNLDLTLESINMGGPTCFVFEGGASNILRLRSAGGLPNHVNLTVRNSGTQVSILSAHRGDLSIEGGVVSFLPGQAGFMHGNLNITGGVLDAADAMLALTSTAASDVYLDTVKRWITLASNGQLGVLSSLDRPQHRLVAALNDNGEGLPVVPALDGESLPVETVLVRYTYLADTNFDGRVNTGDFAMLSKGYVAYQLNKFDPAFAPLFTTGDYNEDGRVDTGDFKLLSMAYVQHMLDNMDAAPAAVPEPALVLPVMAAAGLALRRRRS